MDRRTLLATLGAGALSLSGCLDRPSPLDGSQPSTTTTRTPSAEPTLSVEGVETFSHALRLNDLGESPGASVPTLADLAEREREVFETALDGGYETSDPPMWLVEFLDGTPYVEADGDYYRIDHTLPTYTVTAEETTADEVSGDIATTEEYREAVTHDGRVTTGLIHIAAREGVEFVYVWPSLRAFLDEYDAVRTGTVFDFSVAEDDPGPPYSVTVESVGVEAVAGDTVWNAAEADPALRRVVRAAGETSGLHPLDDPPAGLLEELDAHRYVYLDGRFYTTYVEKRGPLPVSLSAAFTDPSLVDGATLRLTLRNESDRSLSISSGAPWPFGVLRYHPEGDPESTDVLWTDAYEESEHVSTDGHEVTGGHPIALERTVDAGDTADRSFAVENADLPAGRYVVADWFGVRPADADGSESFPYRIHLRVERSCSCLG